MTKFSRRNNATHINTGAIIGVGLSRRLSAVRWGLASRIVWAPVFNNTLRGLNCSSGLPP